MKAITDPAKADVGDLADTAAGRIIEALAILETIERAELLAVLPDGAEAGVRHQCAVSLLAVLRRDLDALVMELQSASFVHELMSRLPQPANADDPA